MVFLDNEAKLNSSSFGFFFFKAFYITEEKLPQKVTQEEQKI